MSTDLHERTSNPSPDPQKPDKPKPALSIAQVVGGALAAMTAAFLGSRLSIAGTVVGAALASVIAAVAGSVYTASLRRTHDRVSAVWQSRTGNRSPGSDAATGPSAEAADPAKAALEDSTPTSDTRRARIGWKPVVAGALAMFALAAIALTGIELATGQALSGGSGTTVGQVSDSRPAPASKPTGKPAASATPSATTTREPSAAPSATPTTGPTTEPTPSATAEPSSSATPSAEPSATPSSTSTALTSGGGSAPTP